ncbi:MAG: hypothetical protein VX614_07225 [Myxococcota bacterium]|nr:hypothetical protein [Myxococcota bacterium]
MPEQMAVGEAEIRVPVSGSCGRCGCPFGYAASANGDAWYCCGACAGSDRCVCGCKPEFARPQDSSFYVPTRRMFASRQPDDLKRVPNTRGGPRAFPFTDPDPSQDPGPASSAADPDPGPDSAADPESGE